MKRKPKNKSFTFLSRMLKIKPVMTLLLSLVVLSISTTGVNASDGNNSITSESTNLQQLVVTGVVTDASTNETLPGVNIVIAGTTSGFVTDTDGKYSFAVTGPPMC